MATTLLRSGIVVDGSGKKAVPGHVLLENDRIAAVTVPGDAVPQADRVVDAERCVIAPGFIDMHSHLEWLMPSPEHPRLMKCFLEQGVTTLVGGNCGFSPAPLSADTVATFDRVVSSFFSEFPLDFAWRSMDDFLNRIQDGQPLVNLALLTGHATTRISFARTERGSMPAGELQDCLRAAEQALEEGSCGLSFGLGYEPGMYSPLEEIEAFCRVAADADKPVTVHLKALSWLSPTYPLTYLKPHNLRALNEMLGIARKTGVRLQLSHFIAVGRRSWRTLSGGLKKVDEARREGVDVMVDAFPYTYGNTIVNAVLPYWYLRSLPRAYHSRLARARLGVESEVGFRLVGFHYGDLQLMDALKDEWEDFNGLTVDEIARTWRISPLDALLRISETSRGKAVMLFHTYSGEPGNEQPLEEVLASDLCLFETDAMTRLRGHPNPAALGTFPKILGTYVRDKRLFGLEDAVRRMTAASAERFGLGDRGVLAPGKAADVVIFDPGEISETPGAGACPAGKPRGIRHVFLNGQQVVENGIHVDNRRVGRVLRV